MAIKTRNTRRTTKVRTNPTSKRRRKPIASPRKRKTNSIYNTLVPLVLLLAILSCLGFLLFKGFQTVTASSFFDVKKMDIRGTSRVSKEEIEKIIRNQADRDGVWNAELGQIKTEIEKLNFVKTVVVSRVLPDGILVRVDERVPRAVVRLNSGDFWVDDEALIVGKIDKNDAQVLFVISGWDESKTEKSVKDNQERIKLSRKIREELQNLNLEKRVSVLNINDLQDIQANVEDSGSTVSIFLGKEDFGKRLQRALTVIEGKGASVESLISHGGNVVAHYRNS